MKVDSGCVHVLNEFEAATNREFRPIAAIVVVRDRTAVSLRVR